MKRAAARILAVGVVAGLAGGIAEVAWISMYAVVTGSDTAMVARGITETLQINSPSPVVAGLSIHIALAALLGIAVAFALRPLRLKGARLFGAMLWALAAVWAINFMVVLPVLNPPFVDIVPLGVSFVSKLLFGIAAAACLQLSGRSEWIGAPA
jgi:hypothetical protein